MCAHVPSPLWAQVLRTFMHLEYTLPNLVVGLLTRESVHSAVDHSISASEIASFLERNAHPRMARQVPYLTLPYLPARCQCCAGDGGQPANAYLPYLSIVYLSLP